MNNKIRSILALLLVSTSGTIKAADTFAVVGAIGMNSKTVTFTPNKKQQGEDEIEIALNTVEASLTGVYKNLYLSANYDTSFDENSEVNSQNNIITRSRKDYSLTLGYNILDGLSLFGGYKYGESLAETLIGITTITGPLPDTSKINYMEFESGVEEKGLFIGAGYSHNLPKNITVGLNLAYADMDGTYTRLVQLNYPPIVITQDGDISGLSYGITFSGPLSTGSQYRIGYKVNSYEYSGKSATGTEVNADEEFRIISIGVLTYL